MSTVFDQNVDDEIDSKSFHPVCPSLVYFLFRFEYDVQVLFNAACVAKKLPFVEVKPVTRKGSLYLEGDFILPLKSYRTLELDFEDLIDRLKRLKYVLDVGLINLNLTFCFKRPDVYKIVLHEVEQFGSSYGMCREESKSILVLVQNDERNELAKTRNKLLAQHIISLLVANSGKVFYSGCSLTFTNQCPEAYELRCSENCDFHDLCSQFHDKLKVSEWKKDSKSEDSICIDAKQYLEKHSLLDKYGKDINSIIVNEENAILKKVALVKHLISDHILKHKFCMPDVVLLIASNGVNRDVWKTGILLKMMEKPDYIQSYCFNQSVKVINQTDVSFDSYLTHHSHGIERSMREKYDSSFCPTESRWSSRIKNLTDTAIKFDFLKLNPSMSLKLDLSECHSTEKNHGIFVQYNFARLSKLFAKFESKVEEGYYEPLQPLNDVDFSLLKLEEEWHLFQYVILFPKLINRILMSLFAESNLKTRYPINGVCVMLTELCHYLSLYYSKIHVLTGPQKHLQMLMNARLWLLKGVYRVMENSFRLLDIQGLDIM